jgi:hypothetical protein
VLSVASYAKGGTATNQGNPNLAKAASLPRPLRFQGRFASKAASLPRPLRFQGRFASKAASLPSQNQTEINHEEHEGHEVFLFFILHGFHVLHG